MSQTVDSLFETGLERYKAEEEPATLIPVLKKFQCAVSVFYVLYLLDNKGTQAYKAHRRLHYIPRFGQELT